MYASATKQAQEIQRFTAHRNTIERRALEHFKTCQTCAEAVWFDGLCDACKLLMGEHQTACDQIQAAQELAA